MLANSLVNNADSYPEVSGETLRLFVATVRDNCAMEKHRAYMSPNTYRMLVDRAAEFEPLEGELYLRYGKRLNTQFGHWMKEYSGIWIRSEWVDSKISQGYAEKDLEGVFHLDINCRRENQLQYQERLLRTFENWLAENLK